MADTGTFDESLAAQRLAVREKLALAMMQEGDRGAQTSTVSNGRVTVAASPFQHLSALLNSVRGRENLDNVDKGYSDLSASHNKLIADAVAKYKTDTAPTPEIAPGIDELGGGPGRRAMPVDPAKEHSAIVDLLASRNPEIQGLGKIEHAASQQRDVLAEQAKMRQQQYAQTQADRAETARKEHEFKIFFQDKKDGYYPPAQPAAPPSATPMPPPPGAQPPAVQQPGGMVVPPDVQAGRDRIADVLRQSEKQPNGGGLIPTASVIPGSAPPPAAPLNQGPSAAPGTPPAAPAPTGEPVFRGKPIQQAEAFNKLLIAQAKPTASQRITVAEVMKDGKAVKIDANTGRVIGDSPTGTIAKPLPTQALKMQQEALDAIATAKTISADLSSVQQQIKDGTLKLGAIENPTAEIRNWMGKSNESSRNLATFKATLERLRNDSLRLNKGVQTEGDAVRAWNEMLKNINDTELVKQRLAQIQNINNRAAEIRKKDVNSIRANFGHPPMDISGYENQNAAVGANAGTPAAHSVGGSSVLKFDANGNPI